MGIPAYLKWKVPQLEAERDRMREQAPSEPEARLARWFEFGQPQIHNSLVAARFSAEQPWYVSHVVAPVSEAEPPQIWGIDLADPDPDQVVVQDGLTVKIVLPAPTLLARDVLVGDKARGVPVYPAGAEVDPARLAADRLGAYFYFARMGAALEKDIEGAEAKAAEAAALLEEAKRNAQQADRLVAEALATSSASSCPGPQPA